MGKFERIFNNQHDADTVSDNIGIDLDDYIAFARSEKSKIVIKNTGIKVGKFNQVKLTLTW